MSCGQIQTCPQDQQHNCSTAHNNSQCPVELRERKTSHKTVHQIANPPTQKYPQPMLVPPWPGAGKMSEILFQLRKDWPIPPAITSNPPIRIEPQPQEMALPPVPLQHQRQRNVDGAQIAPFLKI